MSMTRNLPEALYRANEVRELDRIAIEDQGIGGSDLMARAGRFAYDALRRHWPRARRVCVVCGLGNNAGDGYVLARHAHEAGLVVEVLQLGDAARLTGDARKAWQQMHSLQALEQEFSASRLSDAEVVVDAIFGTGLSRAVEGRWRDAIDAINRCGKPVLAIDLPSGLDADTGSAHGVVVRAEHTVTFVGLKQGMFTGLGPAVCGFVEFDDLGIPAAVYERVTAGARRVTLEQFRDRLAPRSRAAHKGHFGHVLVIGGDYGFAGAARLAAEAAARCGAGLVSVATRRAHAPALVAARPELMAHGVETESALEPLLARASVIALGPGLGQSDWSRMLFEAGLDVGKPLVVDADGLNLLSGIDSAARDDWVLTPHPGEPARMLDADPASVQADRFRALRLLIERYRGVLVLKGSGTLIGSAGGLVGVCSEGNPGMASGGMGDVLTGVIAACLAQGLGPLDAARVGVCLHARAGDAARDAGERGTLASDLMPYLRRFANP